MIAHKRIRIMNAKVEEGPLTYNLAGVYSKEQGWTDFRVVDLPSSAVQRVELILAQGKTVSQILADQARQHGGSWICFGGGPADHEGSLLGLTHKDGKTIFTDIKGVTEGRPHFYYKGGRFGIGRQNKPEGLAMAICGVPTLSKSGLAVDPPLASEAVPTGTVDSQPRIIAGFKKDGSLGLILVDGNGRFDKGLTSREAGVMAVHYGYTDSVQLDSGWGAALATNNRELLNALNIDKANEHRQYHVADMSRDHREQVSHHAICIQFDSDKLLPTYIADHIPRTTPHIRRPGHKLEPSTITVHNTANPTSTARNERNWLTNPTNTSTASYHIVIDEKETIECIPLNESAWHAGDGSGSQSGNRTSIGIEICESGDYARTLTRAADLVASMLRERGWGVERLRRHFDWSGKNCPRLMNADGKWTGWNDFKLMVAAKLQALNESDKLPTVRQLAADEVRIVVDGTELKQRGELRVVNGVSVTYVPVRVVSESLGAKVRWEQSSKTVFIDC